MVVWWSPPPPHALPPTPSHLPTHPPQILKRIGELFPKGAKATRAYLHAEGDVVASLAAAGWTVTRRHMTGTKFYYSLLLEAVPAGAGAA